MMRHLFCLLLLVVSTNTAAESHQDLVARAFTNFGKNFQDEWAFTENATEEGVTWTGRYDPSRVEAERWQLLSVDGREPSAEETDTWLGEKQRELESDRDDDEENGGDNGADMISPDSLALIDETDEHWLFSFVPRDDDEDGDKFLKHVSGELMVVKDGHYVAYIDMHNDAPIKPAFGVKIKEFLTRLQFAPASPDGPIVPVSVDVRIKGRAFLAVGIDETATVRFTNYEKVAASEGTVPEQMVPTG